MVRLKNLSFSSNWLSNFHIIVTSLVFIPISLYWIVFLIFDWLPNFLENTTISVPIETGWLAWWIFYPAHYFILGQIFIILFILLILSKNIKQSDRISTISVTIIVEAVVFFLIIGVIQLHKDSLKIASLEQKMQPIISKFPQQLSIIQGHKAISNLDSSESLRKVLKKPFLIIHESPVGQFWLDRRFLPPKMPIAESIENVKGIIYVRHSESNTSFKGVETDRSGRLCYIIDATMTPYNICGACYFSREASIGPGAPDSRASAPNPDGKMYKWIFDALK